MWKKWYVVKNSLIIKVLGILLEYFCTHGLKKMFPRKFFINLIVEYFSTEIKLPKLVGFAFLFTDRGSKWNIWKLINLEKV